MEKEKCLRALQVDANDNVAVVVQPVTAGDRVLVNDSEIMATGDIIVGHKIALYDISKGDMVIKYGVPIGKASCDIKKGSHVHTQNVEDITTQLCQEYAKAFKQKVGVLK